MSKLKDIETGSAQTPTAGSADVAAKAEQEAKNKAEAEAKAKAAAEVEAKAKAPKLVKMVFLDPPAGQPGEADVHPAEVENYKAGGWRRA